MTSFRKAFPPSLMQDALSGRQFEPWWLRLATREVAGHGGLLAPKSCTCGQAWVVGAVGSEQATRELVRGFELRDGRS